MSAADTHLTEWLHLIRAEYLEVPGLSLTTAQVQQMWGLDPVTAEALLAALLEVNFLRPTKQQAYVRAEAD